MHYGFWEEDHRALTEVINVQVFLKNQNTGIRAGQ